MHRKIQLWNDLLERLPLSDLEATALLDGLLEVFPSGRFGYSINY